MDKKLVFDQIISITGNEVKARFFDNGQETDQIFTRKSLHDIRRVNGTVRDKFMRRRLNYLLDTLKLETQPVEQ